MEEERSRRARRRAGAGTAVVAADTAVVCCRVVEERWRGWVGTVAVAAVVGGSWRWFVAVVVAFAVGVVIGNVVRSSRSCSC